MSKLITQRMKKLHLKSYKKIENIARCLKGEVCMIHIDFIDEPFIDKIIGVRYRSKKVVELTTGFYLVKFVRKILEITLEEQILWKLQR